MDTSELERFSPTRAELVALKEQYGSLVIASPTDTVGFKAVDTARKILKAKRVEITKTGKDLRDSANKFAKAKADAERIAKLEQEQMIREAEARAREEARREIIDEFNKVKPDKAVMPIKAERSEDISFGEFATRRNPSLDKEEMQDIYDDYQGGSR